MKKLLQSIDQCTLCKDDFAHDPRPVLQCSMSSKILIAGQAPGRKVHESGIPFDDPSGARLRVWMGIDKAQFYDPAIVAILPMGFCYPGHGPQGDLPPNKRCAPKWRLQLLSQLTSIQLLLVIGRYAMDWHIPESKGRPVTEVVKSWRSCSEGVVPLPHPSPRNNRWLKLNPWFEAEILPVVKAKVSSCL